MSFYSYAFSLHSELQIYNEILEYMIGMVPQRTKAVPTGMPDIHYLRDACRVLLYNIFVKEQGWRPDPNIHTKYSCEPSTHLEGAPLMLCDRFDNFCLWIAILDSKTFKLVGCMRVMLGHIVELDILNCENCPHSLLQLSQLDENKGRMGECEWILLEKAYRNATLMVYLFYHTAIYILNKDKNIPITKLIGTFERPGLIQFGRSLGAYIDPNWRFKYRSDDKHYSQVLLYEREKLEYLSFDELFRCMVARSKL